MYNSFQQPSLEALQAKSATTKSRKILQNQQKFSTKSIDDYFFDAVAQMPLTLINKCLDRHKSVNEEVKLWIIMTLLKNGQHKCMEIMTDIPTDQPNDRWSTDGQS